ncbi:MULTISPECIES: cytosine permease [Jeotgalicoccus]|uniref:purine-cytosine permease family protein n=1 Tax=Jeotgalicoccus TaxID=227979 RepID=UPI0004286058|nr:MULTISPECIES: cytosine permease [Jeotgalicoccus]QQD84612.1 cytosine permease [Jeotgalicoccus sp. ATCC 8456]
MSNKEASGMGNDNPLESVPLNRREKWLTPAVIFGGLEFTVPVLMVGATLAGAFGISEIFWIVMAAMVLIQWFGNALSGYIGAKTGRPSSVIAKNSFGDIQARLIAGGTIFIASLGWWALQTAVTANALAAMLGINYEEEWGKWAVITVVSGLLFAIPSIIGYNSMKWTDYLAVPAGLILVIGGIYFALRNTGFSEILEWNPSGEMTILAAISLVIGVNVSQWVIAADYTRYAKPTWKDNLLIPLGIIGVGVPLFMVGAVMSVGVGDADIVSVMLNLGFPIWGFLILWLATWTSQLVNNYSMGLAFSNLLNVNSNKGRMFLTLLGTIIALAVALMGILDYFEDFLYLTALVYPAIAGILFADFFFLRSREWKNIKKWNYVATVAVIIGIAIGYYTQYMNPIGLPAVQSLFGALISYYLLMFLKAKIKPDEFTPGKWRKK